MAFTLEIGKDKFSADANMWTLVLYEQEFGTDMLKDFFGRQKADEEDDGAMVLDFTRTNWTAAAKAAWACVKTANPGMPSYQTWCSQNPVINLMDVSREMTQPFVDAYFQAGGSGSPENKPQ